MKTHFKPPGTLPRLGPIGRSVRVLVGIAMLCFAFGYLVMDWRNRVRQYVAWTRPGGLWWLLVILVVFWLPRMIELLFTVAWGWRSLAVWAAVVAGMAVFDGAYYGSLWAAPLDGFLLLAVVAVITAGGVSPPVQGGAARPG